MRYRIGEMAEFFGMTKEGIRFLERKGMITSQRDERNGYRYFRRSEISLLKHLRSYCAMGFSLEEAHQMICDTPQNEVVARLNEKLNELREKEEQLRRMKMMLTEQCHAAEWALNMKDAFEMCMSPDMLFFPRRKEETDDKVRSVEKAWIAAMPPVMMVVECDEDGGAVKGSAVRYQDALDLELPQLDDMVRRTPCRCVHGVLEAPLSKIPDIAPMRGWADDHGYVQCDAAICLVQITYRHEDGNRWTIHEVFLPVCEKN